MEYTKKLTRESTLLISNNKDLIYLFNKRIEVYWKEF